MEEAVLRIAADELRIQTIGQATLMQKPSRMKTFVLRVRVAFYKALKSSTSYGRV